MPIYTKSIDETKKVVEVESKSNAELHKKGNSIISEMIKIVKAVKDKADAGNKEDEKVIKIIEEKESKKKSSNESFSLIRSLLEFDAGDGTNQDDNETNIDIEDPDDTSSTPEPTQDDPADTTPTNDDDPAGATDIDMDDPDAGIEPTSEPTNEPAPADTTPTNDDDPAGATDIDMDDPDAGADAGDVEYTLDDSEGNDPSDDTGIDMDDPDVGIDDSGEGEDPEDPAGDPNIDLDDGEGDGEGGTIGDDTSDIDPNSPDNQDQISGLKAIENELFENLTDKQKQIKIKELKNNFVDLFDRCDGIIDIINARRPSDESTAQIFEYINNAILDLQNTVHDYLEHTFSTRSYLENDAQFKSYLNVLNTINNILLELNIKK